MFFKEPMREAILAGRKSATRRIWKRPHVRAGGVYGVRKGGMYSKEIYFKIKVLDLYKQKLGDMTEEDAIAEGFEVCDCGSGCCCFTALSRFRKYWTKEFKREWNPDEEVHVIRFELCRDDADQVRLKSI